MKDLFWSFSCTTSNTTITTTITTATTPGTNSHGNLSVFSPLPSSLISQFSVNHIAKNCFSSEKSKNTLSLIKMHVLMRNFPGFSQWSCCCYRSKRKYRRYVGVFQVEWTASDLCGMDLSPSSEVIQTGLQWPVTTGKQQIFLGLSIKELLELTDSRGLNLWSPNPSSPVKTRFPVQEPDTPILLPPAPPGELPELLLLWFLAPSRRGRAANKRQSLQIVIPY